VSFYNGLECQQKRSLNTDTYCDVIIQHLYNHVKETSGLTNDLDAVIVTDSTATATPTATPTETPTGTVTPTVTLTGTPIPT
jgi:hypothetical protein